MTCTSFSIPSVCIVDGRSSCCYPKTEQHDGRKPSWCSHLSFSLPLISMHISWQFKKHATGEICCKGMACKRTVRPTRALRYFQIPSLEASTGEYVRLAAALHFRSRPLRPSTRYTCTPGSRLVSPESLIALPSVSIFRCSCTKRSRSLPVISSGPTAPDVATQGHTITPAREARQAVERAEERTPDNVGRDGRWIGMWCPDGSRK